MAKVAIAVYLDVASMLIGMSAELTSDIADVMMLPDGRPLSVREVK